MPTNVNADLQAAISAISLVAQIIDKGQALWTPLKALLSQHGIDADNTVLDQVILDAAKRKAQAELDAGIAPTGV